MMDHEIVSAMASYGGSFAQALAEACRRADPLNFARIKAAFPDLWEHYDELAAGHKAHFDRISRRENDATQG